MFFKITGLAVATLMLAACGGGNTFQLESDPYKDYSLQDGRDIIPYNADNRPKTPAEKPVAFVQTEGCTQPFKLTVQDANNEGALEFTAGEKKSALLVVESSLPKERNWELLASLKPTNSEFEQVEKTETSATYKFTYAPEATASSGTELLVLRYNFNVVRGCEKFDVNPVVNLLVKENPEAAKKAEADAKKADDKKADAKTSDKTTKKTSESAKKAGAKT